jgi:hypothetical protein
MYDYFKSWNLTSVLLALSFAAAGCAWPEMNNSKQAPD